MWLAEVSGARVLFDPLLEPTVHDGVFEVFPRRTIDAAALRPDLLVVTHRHPDHFDPPSLARLARADPDTIVLTADALVARACQRLGFRRVSLLPPWQILEMDGFQLLTTPSFCPVEEWGVLLASDAGTAWNQVDTELGSPDRVRGVLRRAAEMSQRPELADGPDLAIVRWQPLQEVAAVTAAHIGFRPEAYAAELERVAACDARCVIPGAAGLRHVGDSAWLNAHCYPVAEPRFLADLAARYPQLRGLPAEIGRGYTIEEGNVTTGPGAVPVTVHFGEDDRIFAPLEIPRVRDLAPADPGQRRLIEDWVRSELWPAVTRRAQHAGVSERCFRLEVVHPDGTQDLSAGDGEPDVLNRIAASDLAAVIRGDAHWGRALLAGRLRASSRLYRVTAGGLERPAFPLIFLYCAIPYGESMERWTEAQIARLI